MSSTSPSASGWTSGLLGVLIFSGTLPATRVAVADLSPLFLTSARAAIAGVLAAISLAIFRERRPTRAEFAQLVVAALCVVLGFPLLTSLALQYLTASHSLVFVGLLPLSTSIFGVLRGAERPRPAFWGFSIAGAAAVVGFAMSRSEGGSTYGELLMGAAIVVCGLGYAEGATLSRRIGGWQVISWALLLALPPMAAIAFATRPANWSDVHLSSWLGLAYVSCLSMFVGFIFWYRGLALGGIARVGQVQLLQPFFGLVLAGLLLHEPISATMIATALVVLVCVGGAKRFATTPRS